MLKKLIVPLFAHLLLLAAAVWMLLVLLQQSVFTGVLKWVMAVIIPSFGFLTHDYYWRFKIGFIWLNWRVAIGIAKRRGGE